MKEIVKTAINFFVKKRKGQVGILCKEYQTICEEKSKRQREKINKFKLSDDIFEEPPFLTSILTQLGLYFLLVIGFINKILFAPKVEVEKNRDGYVPLFESHQLLYLRYIFRYFRVCMERPICGLPGGTVALKNRRTINGGWTFEFTGTETKCINMGSYNYLGFAEASGSGTDKVIETIKVQGIATSSPRRELGTNLLHDELETLTAQFLGVEDAIVFGMGFATNAFNLPTLTTPGCLVVSDERNHASIILGLKLSGATTKVFKHNDIKELEMILEDAIVHGQSNGAPWKKILIVVEGVFSMEGSFVPLPEILHLKKKYGAYIYLDEAHSVGAVGPRGRGITDYYGIDPNDIDILMGTFTKSFASAGGYIAGSKKLINYLRVNSYTHCYATSMSPSVTQKILTSMKIIIGTNDGQLRIGQLKRNTRYFRRRLAQIGVIVYGHKDSPVVPVLAFNYSKCLFFNTSLAKKNIAVVGVVFPIIDMFKTRIRFCLSSDHTKDQLDLVLSAIEKVAKATGLKHSSKPRDHSPN